MEISVKLDFKKSTKGTNVYSTDEEGAAVKTLYIQKDAMPMVPPKQFTVTITVD